MSRPPRNRRRRRLRRESLNRLLPNALTMLGLCAGLSAIRFGFDDRWQAGVLLIAAAALLDTLDGRMARLMGGPTEFGGQLDSLVDAIAFGVAPVMLMYLWSLGGAGGLGWAVTMLFAVCCVLRLARFNVASAENKLPAWAGSYFSGVPAPAGAGLALLPLILGVETGWTWLQSPWLTVPWIFAVAILMISWIPTWSFKRIRVPNNRVTIAMAVVAAFAAAMFAEPWLSLSGLILAYALTIPFSVIAYRRREAEEASASPATNDPDPESAERP
jgi:CDP-diacylglycerol--serine O-phosphatidyltransferase